jgi:uncharacterized protein YneF (UPF0154 family)
VNIQIENVLIKNKGKFEDSMKRFSKQTKSNPPRGENMLRKE